MRTLFTSLRALLFFFVSVFGVGVPLLVVAGCSTVTVREANAAGGRIEVESTTPNLDAADYLKKACPRGYRIVSDEDVLGPEPEGAPVTLVQNKHGEPIVSVEPGRKVTKRIDYVCDRPL